MPLLLQPYLDQVLNNQDRELLTEAAEALETGAARLAYIGVWLAIAESLRRKFQELAVQDNVAARHLGDIQAREANHKAVDAMLIEKAADYGFVTDAEKTRLRHIYENRNVFGHPYEQRPSQQLVETAAAEAVEIVLGKPTRLRHGYLTEQVRRLTQDTPFLDDLEEAVVDYARGVHARAASDLQLWFLRKLWSALEAVYADPSLDVFARRGEWFTAAFIRVDVTLLEDWDAATDIPNYPKVLGRVFAEPDLFALLDQHGGDIVVGQLLGDAPHDRRALGALHRLLEAGSLNERQTERAVQTFAEIPLARFVASDLPPSAYAQRIITDLKSHNWYVQNPAADAIRRAGAAGLDGADEETLENLGRNITQAAEGDAGEAKQLLWTIGSATESWPPAFVRGVVLEFVANEANDLRFKTRQLESIIQTLRAVSSDDRAAILEATVTAIATGRPRIGYWFGRERDGVVATIREVARTDAELQHVTEIADALEQLEIPEEDEPF